MKIHASVGYVCSKRDRLVGVPGMGTWELLFGNSVVQLCPIEQSVKASENWFSPCESSRISAWHARLNPFHGCVACLQTHRTPGVRRANRSSNTDWLNPQPKWFACRKFVCIETESIMRLAPALVIFRRPVKWTSLRSRNCTQHFWCARVLKFMLRFSDWPLQIIIYFCSASDRLLPHEFSNEWWRFTRNHE